MKPMMRHDSNREWEAEYWDDFIADFGLAAYIQERYGKEEECTRTLSRLPEDVSSERLSGLSSGQS